MSLLGRKKIKLKEKSVNILTQKANDVRRNQCL